MLSRERPYRCKVCAWQGQLVPHDADGAAPCEQCGCYLYPLSWGDTWGLALVMVAAAMGVLALMMAIMTGRFP